MKKSRIILIALAAIVCAGGAIAKKINRVQTQVYYYTAGGACTLITILKSCKTAGPNNCVTSVNSEAKQLYRRKLSSTVCATALKSGL